MWYFEEIEIDKEVIIVLKKRKFKIGFFSKE